MRGVLPGIFCAAALAVLAGCAGVPILPMIEIAGSAKTGYDLACLAAPRERIATEPAASKAQDDLIVSRIRERIEANPEIPVLALRPYAVRGQVYLVGVFRTRRDAERALDLVKRIQGVRSVTGCLFLDNPANPYNESECLELERRIRARLPKAAPDRRSGEVEVVVVQGHALLVGSLRDAAEIQRVQALVRATPGVRGLDSYLTARPG